MHLRGRGGGFDASSITLSSGKDKKASRAAKRAKSADLHVGTKPAKKNNK